MSYDHEGNTYRFKAEITFIDDTILYVKEYLFENQERKYAYHWAAKNGDLICRWDNARHWNKLSTFPNHSHAHGKVLESAETSLEDVLREISHKLKP
jgi:hypothetical protein